MESLNYVFTFIIGIFAGIVFMYFIESKAFRRKRNITDTKFLKPVNDDENPLKDFFRLHRN